MATNVSYVRFLRGTPTAFSKVAKKDAGSKGTRK